MASDYLFRIFKFSNKNRKGNSPSGAPGERKLLFWNNWGKATPLPEHLGKGNHPSGAPGFTLMI